MYVISQKQRHFLKFVQMIDEVYDEIFAWGESSDPSFQESVPRRKLHLLKIDPRIWA